MASSLPGKANMRENNQNLKISRKSLSSPYTSQLSGKVRWDNCSKFQLVSSGQSMRYWYLACPSTQSCHEVILFSQMNRDILYKLKCPLRPKLSHQSVLLRFLCLHSKYPSKFFKSMIITSTYYTCTYIYIYITWYNFPYVFKLLLNFIWTTFQPSSYFIVHSLERRVNAFFSENLHVKDIQK